jgi:hypothetical protein
MIGTFLWCAGYEQLASYRNSTVALASLFHHVEKFESTTLKWDKNGQN